MDKVVTTDIEHCKKLSYDILLKKNKGTYSLFIPELTLFVKDKNLEVAYEKLEQEKENYFQKMLDNDYGQYIPEPRKIRNKNKLFEIVPFFIKFFTVLVILAVGGGFVGSKVMRFGQSQYLAAKMIDVMYYMSYSTPEEISGPYRNRIMQFRQAAQKDKSKNRILPGVENSGGHLKNSNN